MAWRKKYLTDEELLEIIANDAFSDIDVLSDEDDGWEKTDCSRSKGWSFFYKINNKFYI